MSDKEQEPEKKEEATEQQDASEAQSTEQQADEEQAQQSAGSETIDSESNESESSEPEPAQSNLAEDKAFNIPRPDPIEPAPAAVIRPRASAVMRTTVFFLICAIVLLAAALGGVIHFALKEKSELDSRQAELVSRSEDMQRRFREFQNETHSSLQGFNQQRDAKLASSEKSLQQQMNGLIEQMDALSTTTETDWRLAEIEYLTRLASHRLYLAKDIYGARKLLETAADTLTSLSDPGLLPVRQVIAEDLAKVKAASKSDDTATYLKLKALLPQVSVLPLFRQPEVQGAAIEGSEALTGWQRFQQSFDNVATQYFQVRRNTNIKPLLSSDEESLLRQLVTLKIEQAASALLQGKTEIYQSNLSAARDLVAENFLIDEQVVIAFLATVDQLLKANVNPAMPDISASHQAVSQYIERRHGTSVQANKAASENRKAAAKATKNKPANKNNNISAEKPAQQADKTAPSKASQTPAKAVDNKNQQQSAEKVTVQTEAKAAESAQ